MLGWSIDIKRNDETGEQLLYAESKNWGLDSLIRERAEKVLDSAYYPEWGYGYPNRYLIRNSQLPRVEIYRHTDKTQPGDKFYRIEREDLELGPLPDIPEDEILWVELWDQS